MRRTPNVINAYDIIRNSEMWAMNGRRMPGKGIVPARPISAPTLRQRARAALRVFTGRYDALVWPGQE